MSGLKSWLLREKARLDCVLIISSRESEEFGSDNVDIPVIRFSLDGNGNETRLIVDRKNIEEAQNLCLFAVVSPLNDRDLIDMLPRYRLNKLTY